MCDARCDALLCTFQLRMAAIANEQQVFIDRMKNGYRRETWTRAVSSEYYYPYVAVQKRSWIMLNGSERDSLYDTARNARLNSFIVYMCVRTHVSWNLSETNRWFLCMNGIRAARWCTHTEDGRARARTHEPTLRSSVESVWFLQRDEHVRLMFRFFCRWFR